MLSIATTLSLALRLTVRLLLTLSALALLSLLSLCLLPLALLSLTLLALLPLLPTLLLSLLLSVLSALILLRRSLAALIALILLALLTLSVGLILIAALRLALLITALGEATLRAGIPLFLTLAHTLIHRLEATHEIASAVRCLRLLTLAVAGLRRCLCLLQSLAKVGDVSADLLFSGIQPVCRRRARLLLRVPEFFFDFAPAQRVGCALECA